MSLRIQSPTDDFVIYEVYEGITSSPPQKLDFALQGERLENLILI